MSDDWYIDLSVPPKDGDPLPQKTDDPELLEQLELLEAKALRRIREQKEEE
jgi:hypothetical protein